MRVGNIQRETKETKIELQLNLDGSGKSDISTGVGFFDHMLTLLSFHSGFDLNIKCIGDLDVDSHHTVEDVAICLGTAIKEALGDKVGITRYGNFSMVMDEALVHVNLDISNRMYLVYNVEVSTLCLGNYETEMTEEFFRAVCQQAGITLHINLAYGKNTHHIIEAVFKGFARAMKMAVAIDGDNPNLITSSKGML